MEHRIEISPLAAGGDPRGVAVRKKITDFLQLNVISVSTRDVYSVYADLTSEQVTEIAEAFTNPVIQGYVLGTTPPAGFNWLIAVGFLPGVTDNVGHTASDAITHTLNREFKAGEGVYSSIEYLIQGSLTEEEVHHIADTLLANPLIQSSQIMCMAQVASSGIPFNRPLVVSQAQPTVTTIDLDVDDSALKELSDSKTLALTLEEMKAIQAYFREQGQSKVRQKLGLGSSPTDVELEVLAQTWSEHCKHKIFDAIIDYSDDQGNHQHINGCFRDFIKKSTKEIGERIDWLRSVFVDNAGVIGFNDEIDLVYKAETHNSPSALDPYGGAMTGIVGVNRDPLGTGLGADLLVNVWGYCLASPFTHEEDIPEGLLHPRRIRDGVHEGVIEGGNQSGIPYGAGWEFFDKRYLGKPLVFCGTIGTLPRRIGDQYGWEKDILPGDRIVMAGGRIGKDGIHGATFSSEELHADSPVQAVQIGDPITQKKLSDFLYMARDLQLYRFVTDNGAGGLSSSIGEMATICNGASIELANAPLKYSGLQPWEIFVSESQERMSFAVPPESFAAFKALAEKYEVEVSDLGEFTDTGYLHVLYNEATVANIEIEFLHEGFPRLNLKAKWQLPRHPEPAMPDDDEIGDLLLRLLAELNVCSGEEKARQYDHEVKGLSVIKPYVGVGNNVPSDATVFMIEPLSAEGFALAYGVLPRYSDIDTYHMTASVIDLSIRRLIAAGGRLDHIAALDNFCWPDPVQSDKTPDGEYKLAQLVRSNQALYDYTTAFNVPCVSGKDSMKNDSTRGGRKISIPPTLLFSTIGKVDDVSKALSLDVKRTGDLIYVVGETASELGGGELYAMLGATGNSVPKVDANRAIATYQALSSAIDAELLHSAHTPSTGGLAIGFAKIAVGGQLGLEIDVSRIPTVGDLNVVETLFSESNSRFIVSLPASNAEAFEASMAGVPIACVGKVTYDNSLTFNDGQALQAELSLDDLLNAFTCTLQNL